MTMYAMDCAAFDERLADYLEGDLDSAARREVEAHVASCVRCAALLRDLEHIRASAAELPELTPSTDLWGGIARRMLPPPRGNYMETLGYLVANLKTYGYLKKHPEYQSLVER